MALVNTKFYQRSAPSPVVNGNVLASRSHTDNDQEHPFQLSIRQNVFTRLNSSPRLRVRMSRWEAEDLYKSLAFLLGKAEETGR